MLVLWRQLKGFAAALSPTDHQVEAIISAMYRWQKVFSQQD